MSERKEKLLKDVLEWAKPVHDFMMDRGGQRTKLLRSRWVPDGDEPVSVLGSHEKIRKSEQQASDFQGELATWQAQANVLAPKVASLLDDVHDRLSEIRQAILKDETDEEAEAVYRARREKVEKAREKLASREWGWEWGSCPVCRKLYLDLDELDRHFEKDHPAPGRGAFIPLTGEEHSARVTAVQEAWVPLYEELVRHITLELEAPGRERLLERLADWLEPVHGFMVDRGGERTSLVKTGRVLNGYEPVSPCGSREKLRKHAQQAYDFQCDLATLRAQASVLPLEVASLLNEVHDRLSEMRQAILEDQTDEEAEPLYRALRDKVSEVCRKLADGERANCPGCGEPYIGPDDFKQHFEKAHYTPLPGALIPLTGEEHAARVAAAEEGWPPLYRKLVQQLTRELETSADGDREEGPTRAAAGRQGGEDRRPDGSGRRRFNSWPTLRALYERRVASGKVAELRNHEVDILLGQLAAEYPDLDQPKPSTLEKHLRTWDRELSRSGSG